MIKKALITGATSGIGQELAHRLIERGIPLIVTGRNQEELKKYRGQKQFPCDLEDREELNALIDLIHEEKPDLVINCAGFGLYGDATLTPTKRQLSLFDVNVNAAFAITLESAKMMKREKIKGTILNVSSAASFLPYPTNAAYGASKACVNSFSIALHYELKSDGISVLTSCPGMVATNFSQRAGGKNRSALKQFAVMDVNYAAKRILRQIKNKKQLDLFDWKYRIGIFLGRYLLPSSWTAKIISKIMKTRH